MTQDITYVLLMKITVQSSKAVKPDYGSSNGAPSTADVVPLTVLDKVNFDQHISDIFFFHPPAPPSHVLETGLAKTLAVYREWAGRLGVDAKGNRTILLNDDGVRFVEATADVTLDSVMPLEPSPELLRLHPSGDGADELMLVQVTRFACGGFVVATTGQHLVSDGRAARAFIVAWGKAVRGLALDPVNHDRAGAFAPRCPPLVEFEHRGVEFKKKRPHGEEDESVVNGGGDCHAGDDDEVVVRMVRFSRETVAELKSLAASASSATDTTTIRRCSTFQCMVAHLWRCVTQARGLAGDETTTLKIAVDGRARMRDPPVPEGYTGNVVLWARPAATVRDLLTKPLDQVVELISTAVARVDDGYFRSFIDFASSGAVEEEGLVPTADPEKMVHCPEVEVYSQMGIPLYDLDFGTGRPFLYLPSYLPEEGLVFILPSSSGDGSIDVQVCLFSRAMDVFKNCCYNLTEAAEASL